jgi:hypothetical protein
MALVLGSMLMVFMLMVFATYSQPASARSGYSYQYQSAAGVCGGSASCYRGGSKKTPKKH